MRVDVVEGSAIVIVGDDALARSAVRSLIERDAVLAVVGEGALEDLEDLLALGPDVVMWDTGPAAHVSLPPGALSIPVVALVDQRSDATRAFREGVFGVIQRAADSDVLTAAVLAVRAGLRVLDGTFSHELPGTRSRGELVEPLTPRELEVLALLADGLSNRRIASRLEISEHTVKFHVNAILLKLDANSRTEAVVKAARLGVLHL